MKEEIKFSVLLKVSHMYDFLLRHAYRGYRGMIGIIISIGALVLYLNGFGQGDRVQNVLLILMASLFTIINPIHLYYKAFKQVKLNETFRKPLNYKVSKDGITVGQGEEEGQMPWEEIMRVVETRKSMIIYISNVIAYIFPKECLGTEYEPFKKMIKDNIGNDRLKLK